MNRDEFYHKLKAKFEKEVQQNLHNKEIRSVDYQTFRSTFIAKHQNFYEKACGFCEKIYAIKPDAKKKEQLQRSIDASHLHVTPEGTLSFAVFVPLAAMLLVMIAMLFVESLFLIFFFMMFSGISILLFMNLPDYFADAWRMKASNQMILAVFYIVTYMRHTSNLERAIEFASNHLQPPMSLDLQKILWDVENGKYPRVQESLESYLANWTTYNDEFIESMHIIEGSLLEENEQKRLESLDKALDIMLSQTYEKMLHYAHDLQSPITSLHMFGIILPILGLVILPLMVSFMEDIYWYHIAVIYNIGLPVAVYIMGKNILRKRPTGYGAVDIIEDVSEKKKLSPTFLASVVFAFLFLVGLTPILMHTFGVSDFGFGLDVDPAISSCGKSYCFLDYITSDTGSNAGSLVGPFGLGAAVMSLFIPFSFSMAFFIYFSMRSKNTIKIREETQRLEKEFSHALFTFGNRLNDGLPAEMAFADVANNYPNTISGNFFMLVAYNIQKLGMSIEQAINDTKYGALKTYPSSLIQSSMQVLT
ncbi:MAG: hypothetical protein ACMXYC_02645, partial [Candidatus Woesearchaeota archaeon]